MPIDTYSPPSGQEIEDAAKPHYEREAERIRRENTIDLYEQDAPDVGLLSRIASDQAKASLAAILNHDTQPRPTEVKKTPLDLMGTLQADKNIEVKREEALAGYMADREEPPASFLEKTLSLVTGSPVKAKRRRLNHMTERQLVDLESVIGKDLFGPIPADHRRDFFYFKDHTWIWHEEWNDIDTGQRRATTTRYEVQPTNGILKADGVNYRYLDGQELENFGLATRMYYEEAMKRIYKTDPYTGEPIVEDTAATI